jgi:glycosyltransferase involved in cell wall biosynthesis
MKVALSIITPTYCSERTIKRTLDSILCQTETVFEHIVIDGSSRDNTIKIIESYREKYTSLGIKFKIISEHDKGIYDAINKGIYQSSGDWIWIVNSDDFLPPKAVEIILENISSYSYKLIFGNINLFNSRGNEIGERSPLGVDKAFRGMPIFHPACVVSRFAYDAIGVFDLRYKLSADYDWILRFLKGNLEYVYVSEILSNYTDGGLSTKKVFSSLLESFYVRINNGQNIIISYFVFIRSVMISTIARFLRKIFKK